MVGLINIYMFLSFVLAFFAILGVNLFAGYQNRACRTSPNLQYIVGSDGNETPLWEKAELDNRLCNSNKICDA